MKIRSKVSDLAFFGVVVFCLVGVLAVQVRSQTPRKQPTPTPRTETPQIVSRADDFPSNDQIISPEPIDIQSGTLDEKIEEVGKRLKELGKRLSTLESSKENQYDQMQKRLLLNLDILTRSEQRSETLRKQLFELIEKENEIRAKLDQIEIQIRPEVIERVVSSAGSLRPEELREQRRKSLELERESLTSLLGEISTNKVNLQTNVEKSDQLVEKLRTKLEKEIDEALIDKDDN